MTVSGRRSRFGVKLGRTGPARMTKDSHKSNQCVSQACAESDCGLKCKRRGLPKNTMAAEIFWIIYDDETPDGSAINGTDTKENSGQSRLLNSSLRDHVGIPRTLAILNLPFTILSEVPKRCRPDAV